MTGRRAVALVAGREVRERAREKSFLISTAVSVTIIVLVVVIPQALGLGGTATFVVGATDAASLAVARAAARGADAFDAEITASRLAPGDSARAGRRRRRRRAGPARHPRSGGP